MSDREKINEIILGKGSLQELKPYFRSQEDLLGFYAKRINELFLFEKPLVKCEACRAKPPKIKVTFSWRGLCHNTQTAMASALGIVIAVFGRHFGHLFMPVKQIDFSTTHGFCLECFRKLNRRWFLSRFLRQICLVLVVIGAMALAADIVFISLFVVPNPSANNIIVAIGIGFSGVLGALAGLKGIDSVARYRVPNALRFICKSPFELIEIQQVAAGPSLNGITAKL